MGGLPKKIRGNVYGRSSHSVPEEIGLAKAIHQKNPSCPAERQVEQTAGMFKEMYEGFAPWDIGRPQKAIIDLEAGGEIRGSVLDVGCGTGENSLFLASKGHDVWGVDLVESAIERAKEKARDRGLKATFKVHSAFKLDLLGRKFDTIMDCGMFHNLDDDERVCFLDNLRSALAPGGTYHMLCFSEKASSRGPRRLSQPEIRSVFHDGLTVARIRASFFETTVRDDLIPAWLASVVRK